MKTRTFRSKLLDFRTFRVLEGSPVHFQDFEETPSADEIGKVFKENV